MKKLDKENRVNLPKSVIEICDIDFTTDVMLYLYTDYKPNALLLSNDKELALPCFGVVNFDDKKRFYLLKELRAYFKVKPKNELLIYCLNKRLIIEVL